MAQERRRKGPPSPAASLKNQVEKAFGEGGDAGVWIREDGAVCFGDECVVIKPAPDGTLDLEVKPDRCGADAGSVILDHLIKTAGKGVNIRIPPADITSS